MLQVHDSNSDSFDGKSMALSSTIFVHTKAMLFLVAVRTFAKFDL